MMMIGKARGVFVGLLLAAGGGLAMAEDSVYLMMSNRIGLLTYCKAQGAIAADVADHAIARYSTVRKSLPASSATELAAKLEEAGRQGRWGTRGIAIADHAKTLGLTLAEFCIEHAE